MKLTPTRLVDIAALFPELVGQERPAVRLYPRPGRPSPRDNSVSGPLLCPAADRSPGACGARRCTRTTPRVLIHWQASAPILGLPCNLAAAPPRDPGTALDDFIPKPCSVSLEQTADYPGW
jgi:hypothetical protein